MVDLICELPEQIRTAKQLPSLPAVAIEVLRINRDPEAEISELANAIAMDPVLVMRIVRMANSPRFRRGREITNVEQAASVLGMRAVSLLALSFSLCSSLPKTGDEDKFSYSYYWKRSITTAVAARGLVRLVKTKYEDEAFICGLLGRLGQLIMATAISSKYGSVCAASTSELPSAEEEKAALGYDFHSIGGAMLSSWEMPELVAKTVAGWGDDAEDGDDAAVLRRFVKAGDSISKLVCEDASAENLRQTYDRMVAYFGLSDVETDQFIISLQQEVLDVSNTLDIDAPEDLDYWSIVEQGRFLALQISMEAIRDLEDSRTHVEQLKATNVKLDVAAKTDALTQLPNRGYFEERLQNVIEARLQSKLRSNLGILVMDIDHFKSFNDTHGHLAGDEVLKAVGARLVKSTRDTDSIARYGGEEFVAILPNTTLVDLESVAERIRRQIEKETIDFEGESLNVTISVGGACVPQVDSMTNAKALFKIADQCLYEAKEAGRNQSRCREVGSVVEDLAGASS